MKELKPNPLKTGLTIIENRVPSSRNIEIGLDDKELDYTASSEVVLAKPKALVKAVSKEVKEKKYNRIYIYEDAEFELLHYTRKRKSN